MKQRLHNQNRFDIVLSVLSVEPYGMKLARKPVMASRCHLSVLSVEPYGMKQGLGASTQGWGPAFSALGRAVWDETLDGILAMRKIDSFSALGRAVWDETAEAIAKSLLSGPFSALGRAVWDETKNKKLPNYNRSSFQCSRSSRMG